MTSHDPHDLKDAPDGEALAGAFAEAARARRPSRFETARAARELDVAIDRVERRRRAWRPGVVATAVVLAGALGVAGGVALRPRAALPGGVAPSTIAVAVAGVAGAAGQSAGLAGAAVPTPASELTGPPPTVQPAVAALAEPAVLPAAALLPSSALAAAPQDTLAPVRRSGAWRASAEALAAAGDDLAAARVLATALRTDDAAAMPLVATLRRMPDALDAVDATLAGSRHAEAMRVRCEMRLLYRRDRGALDACRAFAQQWPEHPGARVLSFAAGRVAEDELGDLEAAETEFSRAILLAPLAGLSSTDALLARARVRAARGVLDEARADLRLYLHQEPAASRDPAVHALTTRLGLEKEH